MEKKDHKHILLKDGVMEELKRAVKEIKFAAFQMQITAVKISANRKKLEKSCDRYNAKRPPETQTQSKKVA